MSFRPRPLERTSFALTLIILSISLAILHRELALLAVLTPILTGEGFTQLLIRALGLDDVVPVKLVFKGNYAVDLRNRLVHLFYKVEPLYDISTLSGPQYVSLIGEMLRRLCIGVDVYITFMALDRGKYVRLSIRFDNLKTDIWRIKAIKDEVVRGLGEYFVLHELKGDEIRSLINARRIGPREYLPRLILLLTPFLLLGIYGLITAVALAIYSHAAVLRHLHRVSHGVSYALSSISPQSMPEYPESIDSLIKAQALSVLRRVNRLIITIALSPELQLLADRELGRSGEKLVVEERYKRWYVRFKRAKALLDRLHQGEDPFKVQVFTDCPIELGNASFIKDRLIAYALYALHDSTFKYALTRDIAQFLPIVGGELRKGSMEVQIGHDESERPVYIDLEALPSTHGLVTGATGMGKTRTVKAILSRLRRSRKDISIIVIDPHGEYGDLGLDSIDVTREMVNFLIPYGPVEFKAKSLIDSIAESFGVPEDALGDLYADVNLIYERNLHKDPLKAFKTLIDITTDDYLRIVYSEIYGVLKNVKIVPPDSLFNKAIVFRGVLPRPDLTKFLMFQVVDTIYNYVLNSGFSRRPRILLVIDEAYYILSSQIAEYFTRGLRKFGLGVIFVTQSLGDVSPAILKNLGFIIILGGPDAYAREVVEFLRLGPDDYRWLITALPPHMSGDRVKALLLMGPIKKHIYVELKD